MKNIDYEDRLWKKLFAEEDTEEEPEQNIAVPIQAKRKVMTDYEKEQILKLVGIMLDNGKDYAVWTILNPDWDKINTREAFTKKTFAVSIKEIK